MLSFDSRMRVITFSAGLNPHWFAKAKGPDHSGSFNSSRLEEKRLDAELPAQNLKTNQTTAQQHERPPTVWDGGCLRIRVDDPRFAVIREEYVGREEVPTSILGFQLRNRRVGDGEREARDRWRGSPVAVRERRAFDRCGEIPGTAGMYRR